MRRIKNISKWIGKKFPKNYDSRCFYDEYGWDYFISDWSRKIYHVDDYVTIRGAESIGIEDASLTSREDEHEIYRILRDVRCRRLRSGGVPS